MRKSLLLLFFLSLSCYLMAQETVKRKEIGLAFSSLDNFGLTFRTGTDKSLWRFNTLLISGNNMDITADSLVRKQNNTGFGVTIGKEYRKEIANNLALRFGADISFTYSQSKSDSDDKTVNNYDQLNQQTYYSPGVNLVFGINYKLNDNLLIGAEVLPNFSYTTGTSIQKYYYINNGDEFKSDISGFNYGLSNTSVLLSLVYRF